MRQGKSFELAYMLASYLAAIVRLISRHYFPAAYSSTSTSAEWITPFVAPFFAPFYFAYCVIFVFRGISTSHFLEAAPDLVTLLIFVTAFWCCYQMLPYQRIPWLVPTALYLLIGAGVIWAVVLVAQMHAIGPAGAN